MYILLHYKGDKEMSQITGTNPTDLAKIKAEEHPVSAYLTGLSSGSLRGQLTALRAAIAAVTQRQTSEVDMAEVPMWAWHTLTPAHMAALRSALQEQYSPAYANKILSAVRGVLKSSWRLGLMTHEDYARSADVKSVKGETLPAGRDITPAEIAMLMRCCYEDNLPAGVRDAALIGFGLVGGLRIAEASGLDIDDYESTNGRLVIRGKGNKERSIYVDNGAKDALDDWLTLLGSDNGPLFVRIRKGGVATSSRISPTSIHRMLKKRANESSLEPMTWHDLRRTCAGDLLDAGVDLVTVQKLLGHARLLPLVMIAGQKRQRKSLRRNYRSPITGKSW